MIAGIIKDERPWHSQVAKRPLNRHKMRLQQKRIHSRFLLLDLAGERCQMLLGHHQGLHDPDGLGRCFAAHAAMGREQILADRLPCPLCRSRHVCAFGRCHIEGVPAGSRVISSFARAGHGRGVQFRGEGFYPRGARCLAPSWPIRTAQARLSPASRCIKIALTLHIDRIALHWWRITGQLLCLIATSCPTPRGCASMRLA